MYLIVNKNDVQVCKIEQVVIKKAHYLDIA